jgi:SAM-dependent methyltransferase
VSVKYDHSRNFHTLEGPAAALPFIFPDSAPRSALDVGCGTGTWLRAFLDRGQTEVFGVDGVNIPPEKLLFDPKSFRNCDLTSPINLERKFDVVICLEVAEHLDAKFAPTLIQTLTRHADMVVFSAACPNQPGENHVNCQWPEYWQGLFNREGFACEDSIRWKIWPMKNIEPWYRQNMFVARRSANPVANEPRILSVMHPEMFNTHLNYLVETIESYVREEQIRDKTRGARAIGFHVSNFFSRWFGDRKRFAKRKEERIRRWGSTI